MRVRHRWLTSGGGARVRDLLLAGPEQSRVPRLDSAAHLGDLRGSHSEAVQGRRGTSAACKAKLDGGGVERDKRPTAAVAGGAKRAGDHGIGHTRWGRRMGGSARENGAPALRSGDRIQVVVNGIVENYMALKEALIWASGRRFTSEDRRRGGSRNLVAEHYTDGNIAAAVRSGVCRARRGHYGGRRESSGRKPELLVGGRRPRSVR